MILSTCTRSFFKSRCFFLARPRWREELGVSVSCLRWGLFFLKVVFLGMRPYGLVPPIGAYIARITRVFFSEEFYISYFCIPYENLKTFI